MSILGFDLVHWNSFCFRGSMLRTLKSIYTYSPFPRSLSIEWAGCSTKTPFQESGIPITTTGRQNLQPFYKKHYPSTASLMNSFHCSLNNRNFENRGTVGSIKGALSLPNPVVIEFSIALENINLFTLTDNKFKDRCYWNVSPVLKILGGTKKVHEFFRNFPRA